MWKIFSASPFLIFINNISNLSNILRYTSPAEQSKPNGTSLCQSSTLRISQHLCIAAPGWLCHKELCSLSCQVFCSCDRAYDIQSAVTPRVIPVYLFLQQPTQGIAAQEGSNPWGRGKWNWESDLPVPCERTMVMKGLSWLLCGGSIWVLCPVGKRRCFCMEQRSAGPACAAVSVWSCSVLQGMSWAVPH